MSEELHFTIVEKEGISPFRASMMMSASSQEPICPLADLSHSTMKSSTAIDPEEPKTVLHPTVWDPP
jgi:hypothetical protein